ncbi:hypothetical protein [Devosia sp. RR2S18]|uniref:hypothetical protein n=1 Tax=Devosia rhizosphaerae TaxID=3049774 RepID=UPI002541E388|nr:hypothetical protein [Devosia sp. RR2S18]WIJ25885.1 hypothetical protein QOV41_03730 [Devosia sp. RR2S18]
MQASPIRLVESSEQKDILSVCDELQHLVLGLQRGSNLSDIQVRIEEAIETGYEVAFKIRPSAKVLQFPGK